MRSHKASKLSHDFMLLWDSGDLKKNGLTYLDYEVLYDKCQELYKDGKCVTCNTPVKNWLEKHGCKVYIDKDNVNYIITLE